MSIYVWRRMALLLECTWCDETKSANARIVMDDFQMLTLGQGTMQTRETVQDIAFPKPKENFGRWLEPAIDTGPAMMVNKFRST